MRVLHFNHYGGNIGGAEGYIAEVSAALIAAGHDSHFVFFTKDDTELAVENSTYIEGIDGEKKVVESQAQLNSLIAQIEYVIADHRPDVAFVHTIYDPELLSWIFHRLPATAYVHSPYVACPGYALYLRRSAQTCTHKAGLVCLLNAQVEQCCFGHSPIAHYRHLQNRRALLKAYIDSQVQVLVGSKFMQEYLHRNGIPLAKIGLLSPVLISHDLAAYRPSPEPQTILFAGRLIAEKGLAQLLQALAPIQTAWQLLVAGDGSERSAYEQLAHQLGLAQRIKFLGQVQPHAMQNLYASCGFVAIPSLWPEPYGRTGPEAFAYGRPVVAFAVGGIPDWLDDEQTGLLASPGNVPQLTTRINELLESPVRQEMLGRAALEKARISWNAQVQVDQLLIHLDRSVQTAIPR